MIVMGIKSVGHDCGAAIIADDGDKLLIHAIAEARLNRIKHSWRYPLLSIQYCLDALGLKDLGEIDYLFCDWHVGQVGQNIPTRTPLSHDPHCDTVDAFNHVVHSLLNIDREKVHYCAHLAAHAASSYYLSPFDEAASLVIDGGYGLYRGAGNTLTVINANGYYDSWVDGSKSDMRDIATAGVLYEFITTKLGFSGFDAGKTMALASYAEKYQAEDHFPIPKNRHSSLWTDYRPYINWIRDNIPKFEATKNNNGSTDLIAAFWVNLARQSQKILEEDVLFLVENAIKKTEAKNLTYAGGVALSCITNRKIFDRGIAENIFIQPSSSDEGIALGCALWGYYEKGGKNRTTMDNAYLGKKYDPKSVEQTLKNNKLDYKTVTPSEVAMKIANGAVIGRIANASEYGPRALGNRSILADPCNSKMMDKLNKDIKHRERFRPFAPSVIFERRNDYFDMPMEGPYMNVAAAVRPEMVEKIPAVTHIDGSCRPQTVRREQNPSYYDLLTAFGEETGIYCLINTSFNDNGEPIVETYDDAARTFRRTEIDYLYVENYLAWKTENQKADRNLPLGTEEKYQAYQDLIEKYLDRGTLTKILGSITLDDGRQALAVCSELTLFNEK